MLLTLEDLIAAHPGEWMSSERKESIRNSSAIPLRNGIQCTTVSKCGNLGSNGGSNQAPRIKATVKFSVTGTKLMATAVASHFCVCVCVRETYQLAAH